MVLTPDVKRERIAKTNKFMTNNILFSLDETEHKTEKIGRNTEDILEAFVSNPRLRVVSRIVPPYLRFILTSFWIFSF